MVQSISYRLRGGQITPISPNCTGTGAPSTFYLQTFGAEKIVSDIFDAKTTILRSLDFQGQKPGDHEDLGYTSTTYSSASYSGRAVRTTDGELVYAGTETFVPTWIEEEQIGQ
jgi:hypothetical protein